MNDEQKAEQDFLIKTISSRVFLSYVIDLQEIITSFMSGELSKKEMCERIEQINKNLVACLPGNIVDKIVLMAEQETAEELERDQEIEQTGM